MNILIIGGTGFIGSVLVRQLCHKNYAVTLFHRSKSNVILPSGVRQLYGHRESLEDLHNAIQVVRPDVIIDTIALFQRHITILEQALGSIKTRTVLLSSIDVYKGYEIFSRMSTAPVQPIPFSENSSLREKLYPYRGKLETDFAYDYEKILVEKAALSSPVLNTSILRLGMVYGPNDPNHRFTSTIQNMLEGQTSISLNKEMANWRGSKCYVENVAQGIVLMAEQEEISGGIYNLSEEHPLTELEWTQKLAALMDWQGEICLIPDEDAAMNKLDINPLQHLVANTSKIRKQLGYQEAIPLEEGLRRTIDWELHHPSQPV